MEHIKLIHVVNYQNRSAEFESWHDAYMFSLTLKQDGIEYSFRTYGLDFYTSLKRLA